MQTLSAPTRVNFSHSAQSGGLLDAGSVSRRGSAALQSVMILAVAMTVLLAMLRLWAGENGSGGMKDAVQDRLQLVLAGGEDSDRSDSPDQPDVPGQPDPQDEEEPESDPPETDELSEQDRRRIAQLRAEARRLNGRSNLAALAGEAALAKAYKALSDAALLEVAHIRGPDFLRTEIAAIAATRSVEATADALLKAIEQRVPIARFVALPIVDGLGQLTGDFVRWWRSNQ